MTAIVNEFFMPLPWHHALWKQWYHAAQCAKLSHALLLQGPSGSGKTHFIKAFAQLMLCSDPPWISLGDLYHSCEKCSACLWYKANTHPNYYEIQASLSAAGKSYISIEQIRNLTQSLQQTAMNSTHNLNKSAYHTVIIIDPIDALQVPAMHALLKTLEEPLLGVLFIVATAQPQKLIATIRSRCQKIILPQPDVNQALAWMKDQLSKTNLKIDAKLLALSLSLANNMPLQALSYLKHDEIMVYQSVFQSFIHLSLKIVHPMEVAKKWAQYPMEKILDYLMRSTAQWIRVILGEVNLDREALDISTQEITQFIKRIPVEYLFQYWDKLQNTRSEMGLYNLNPLLALEMLAYMLSSSRSFS
jgi:DNA polymerase-3 subunit delta'